MINLYSGNNTVEILLEGLKDTSAGTYINDATVTATIYESDGTTEVTGETWPVTLDYVSGSNGNYLGAVSADSIIVACTKYKIKVLAVDTFSNKGEWEQFAIAQVRDFS